jgi:nucleoside-diphosphate-sugar epimerase
LSRKPRVLVTGAGGFIGRHSVEPLRRLGYEVYAAVSPRTGAAEGLGRTAADMLQGAGMLQGAEVLRADLTDGRSIDALIREVRPSHLLHFAWIATPGLYWQSPDNYRWLAASRHLLEAFQAAGGTRAVMAGSCAEYDWSKVTLCHERTSPLAMEPGAGEAARVTPYAACKIALERVLEGYGRGGLSTAWGRIFFQYGPGEHRARLVASVVVNLLAGREAPCTHGRQVRSFLHVEDVGAAFAALLSSGVEGPVNIGSGESCSIGHLLERLATYIGRPDLLKLGAREPPPGEPPVLVPDVVRLSKEVGFRPKWGLEEGLRDTVRWWREQELETAR